MAEARQRPKTVMFALRGEAGEVEALKELKAQARERLGLESDAALVPIFEEALRAKVEGAAAPALNDDVAAIRRALSVVDARVGAIVAAYAAQADEADRRWAARVEATAAALAQARAESEEALAEARRRAEAAEAEAGAAREAAVRAEAEAADLRRQLEEARGELARAADVSGRLDEIMGALRDRDEGEGKGVGA